MEKLKPILLSLALMIMAFIFVGFMPNKAKSVNGNAAQETETTTNVQTTASKIIVKKGSIKIKVLKSKKVTKVNKKFKKMLSKKRYKKYTFFSVNPEVAKVTKKGKIKGLLQGKTLIFIKKNNIVYGKIKVTVKKLKTSITLTKGEKIKINKIKKLKKMKKKTTFIYTLSKSKIVKVNKKGFIKAKKRGKTTLFIYKKTNDRVGMRKFAKIKIKVKKAYAMKGKFIGRFQLTAYCPCSSCCGSYANGITASGRTAQVGRTVACNSIPMGTHVVIKNHEYVVEDTGGMSGNVIDVYLGSHSTCLQFGRKFDVPVYYAE